MRYKRVTVYLLSFIYNANVPKITEQWSELVLLPRPTASYLITDKVATVIKYIRRNSTQISAAYDRENSRFHDRQSPTFFTLDIYSALSWGARALRAHYIVTSIESISLKAIVVNLSGLYGVCGKRVCQDFISPVFIDIDYYDYYPVA